MRRNGASLSLVCALKVSSLLRIQVSRLHVVPADLETTSTTFVHRSARNPHGSRPLRFENLYPAARPRRVTRAFRRVRFGQDQARFDQARWCYHKVEASGTRPQDKVLSRASFPRDPCIIAWVPASPRNGGGGCLAEGEDERTPASGMQTPGRQVDPCTELSERSAATVPERSGEARFPRGKRAPPRAAFDDFRQLACLPARVLSPFGSVVPVRTAGREAGPFLIGALSGKVDFARTSSRPHLFL